LPLRRRWLRGRLRPSGSLEGGVLLLWLSLAKRASNSCTRAQCSVHCPQLLILLLLSGHQGFQFGNSFLLPHASMLDPQRKSA